MRSWTFLCSGSETQLVAELKATVCKETKTQPHYCSCSIFSFSWSKTVHADQKRPQWLLVSRTEGKMDGWLDGYGWGMWTDSPPRPLPSVLEWPSSIFVRLHLQTIDCDLDRFYVRRHHRTVDHRGKFCNLDNRDQAAVKTSLSPTPCLRTWYCTSHKRSRDVWLEWAVTIKVIRRCGRCAGSQFHTT